MFSLFAFTGIYVGEGSEAFSAVATKELIQPFFCGSTSEVNSIYTDSRTGQSFPLINKVNDLCDGIMSVPEIKHIDLSNVEFCDMTLPDDVEDYCEKKDMSFLTADI